MRSTINFFCTFLIVILSAAGAIAQESVTPTSPCYLDLRDAPDFRSVKLGMSSQEVAAILKIDIKLTDLKYEGSYRPERTDPLEDEEFVKGDVDVGSKVFYWNIISNDSREGFDGIRSFYFYFFEDRLYLIYSSYYDKDDHYYKAGLKTLTQDLSQKFALPQDAWTFKASSVMKCQDFGVRVTIYNQPITQPNKGAWVLVIWDMAAIDKLTKLVDLSVKEYYLTNRTLILEKKRGGRLIR